VASPIDFSCWQKDQAGFWSQYEPPLIPLFLFQRQVIPLSFFQGDISPKGSVLAPKASGVNWGSMVLPMQTGG
jgi:hypothetical protein